MQCIFSITPISQTQRKAGACPVDVIGSLSMQIHTQREPVCRPVSTENAKIHPHQRLLSHKHFTGGRDQYWLVMLLLQLPRTCYYEAIGDGEAM
jgi:hypothetical protein